jgi:hypothetical protein
MVVNTFLRRLLKRRGSWRRERFEIWRRSWRRTDVVVLSSWKVFQRKFVGKLSFFYADPATGSRPTDVLVIS